MYIYMYADVCSSYCMFAPGMFAFLNVSAMLLCVC